MLHSGSGAENTKSKRKCRPDRSGIFTPEYFKFSGGGTCGNACAHSLLYVFTPPTPAENRVQNLARSIYMATAPQTLDQKQTGSDSFAAYLDCDLDLYVVSAEHENRLWLAKQSLNALCWMFGAVEDAARPMAAGERHKANITVPSESMQCLLQVLKDQIDSVSLVSYRRVAAAREGLQDQSTDDLTPATH